MQWISADIVFDGYNFFTNYYIQVDDTGMIRQIAREQPRHEVNHYRGLLMPGMVNAHCHLELSHTKGAIEEKTGLSTFLQKVNEQNKREVPQAKMQEAMKLADQQMQANGIVAVGDICNTKNSRAVKVASEVYYHNFIECIAIRKQDTERRFAEYREVLEYLDEELHTTFALHTPYTCNEDLYKLVNEIPIAIGTNFISIHNQESEAENLLFERKAGDFDNFYQHFFLDKKEIIGQQTCTSSFENSMRLINADTKKLFVHNTFTREQDLVFADENTWFCFCPKANLYIENQLPNISIFLKYENKIVLGTDSLASNDSLNILAEAKTIQNNFPEIPLNKILQWATINGAKLFGLEDTLGSFEVGKIPGLVNVDLIDLKDMKLGNQIRRLD